MTRMTFTFNLLVSTPRNFETDALAELDFLMFQLDPEDKFNYGKTIVKGLAWGNLVNHDPVQLVRSIKEFVETTSFPLQYLLKFVPIEVVVPTDITGISEYVASRLGDIKEDEKFKIVVNKRRIALDRSHVIDKIAKEIDRKVDLENPDKILRLEIIGKYTGISILEKDDVYSIGKAIF